MRLARCLLGRTSRGPHLIARWQNEHAIYPTMYSLRRAPLALGLPSRLYSTTRVRTRRPFRTTLLLTSVISGGALLGLYSDAKSCPSPPFELAETHSQPRHDTSPPLLTLLRTYFVYSLISSETIVDYAPQILDTLLTVPLVKMVVEGVVRQTFFAHVRMHVYAVRALH